MMGFTGTVDTLCGQAWGAKNYRAFGLVVQVRSRSWVCVCWMQEWCRVLCKAHAGRTAHTSLAGSTAPYAALVHRTYAALVTYRGVARNAPAPRSAPCWSTQCSPSSSWLSGSSLRRCSSRWGRWGRVAGRQMRQLGQGLTSRGGTAVGQVLGQDLTEWAVWRCWHPAPDCDGGPPAWHLFFN